MKRKKQAFNVNPNSFGHNEKNIQMTMGMKKQTFIFFTTTYRSGEIITIRMSSRTYHKGKSKGKNRFPRTPNIRIKPWAG